MPKPWGSHGEQYRIVHAVEKAISRAQGPTHKYPHPTILITTYLLDRSRSVDELISACRRGISVRVILDHDIVNRNSKRLIRALNGDNVRDGDDDGVPDSNPHTGRCGRPFQIGSHQGREKPTKLTDRAARRSVTVPTGNHVTWGRDQSYVKRCSGSCRGGGGNMHLKMYVFSRTGKARNVIMVSSSNLNRGGAEMGWNDLYVMRFKPKSYAFYKKIHRQMTAERKAPAHKRVQVKDGPFTSRFFPMRRAGKRKDPTLKDLNKIGCSSAYGRTEISVSMFYWKGKRGNYITNKLFDLARQGCNVNIIYGAPSIDMATRLREAARNHLIDLWDSRWDFNGDGFSETRTHGKYVLVKGKFGKDRSAHVVMTGSQNWVMGSLRLSDESTLNIKKRSAYKQYIRQWNAIRVHSRRLPYTWRSARNQAAWDEAFRSWREDGSYVAPRSDSAFQ